MSTKCANMSRKELNSLFDDALDELEVTYDIYFEIDRYRPRGVHVLNRLLSDGVTGGKVLVFGKSEKPFTMLFEKLGFQVEGFNLHETSVVLRKIRDLQGAYDVIICDDVLQYLTSPADVLTALKECVRPGGLLTITTPNAARGALRLRLLTGGDTHPLPENQKPQNGSADAHASRLMTCREYTLQGLESLVHAGGFELMRKEFIAGTYVNTNTWPPMPLKEYFLQTMLITIGKIAPPLRNYLFVAVRRPFSHEERNRQEQRP
jgi:SAM-dependent methyltransferase